MFDAIRRIIGAISVEENDTDIRVTGLPADMLSSEIRRIWGTSRVATHMFKELTRSRIVVDKFFGLELLYMMERIVKEGRLRSSRSAANHIVEALYANTWLKDTLEDYPNFLDRDAIKGEFPYKPLPHQEDFFNTFEELVPRYNLKGFLLGSPAGSGKTLSNFMLSKMLHVDVVLVVTIKASLYNVWVKTTEKELNKKHSYWVSGKGITPKPGKDVYIAHYQAMDELFGILPSLKDKRVMIVLDESHHMNEIGSTRTQTFIRLCKETREACVEHDPYVIWASGTPMKAMGKEAIPFLACIDPLFTKKVQERYTKIFGINAGRALDILAHRLGVSKFMTDKDALMNVEAVSEERLITVPNGNDFTLEAVGAKMRDFITERMEFYRQNFDDYLQIYNDCLDDYAAKMSMGDKTEFNEYRRQVRVLRKANDYRHLVEEMKYCNWFEKTKIEPILGNQERKDFRDAKSVVKYVILKVKGECLGRILGKARVDCHIAMIPYAGLEGIVENSVKKTIIFTSYTQVATALASYLEGKGYTVPVVYGETNKDLPRITAAFEKDPKQRVLVATYASLSTAVPMVMANTAVLFNSPFRDYEHTQATSRVHRLGQDTTCSFINMFLNTGDAPNVSTRSKDIMEWSRDQVNQILGIKTDESVSVEDDFDFDDYYAVVDDLAMASTETLTTNGDWW